MFSISLDDIPEQAVIMAISPSTSENLAYAKEVIKNLVNTLGFDDVVKLDIIVYGSNISDTISSNSPDYPDQETFLKAVEAIKMPTGNPSVAPVIAEAVKLSKELETPENTKKTVVVMADKKATDTPQEIEKKVKSAKESGMKILSTPLSPEAAKDNELLTGEKEATVNINPSSDNPKSSSEEVIAEIGMFIENESVPYIS